MMIDAKRYVTDQSDGKASSLFLTIQSIAANSFLIHIMTLLSNYIYPGKYSEKVTESQPFLLIDEKKSVDLVKVRSGTLELGSNECHVKCRKDIGVSVEDTYQEEEDSSGRREDEPRPCVDAMCMRTASSIQSSLLQKSGSWYKYIFLLVLLHTIIQTCLIPALNTLGWRVGGHGGNPFWWDETRFMAHDDNLGACPCDMKIPKIIHQTYKQTELPDQWKQTPVEWQEKHPDWKYEFWTDDRNRKLIEEHYPWFLEQYDSYDTPIQRADSVRYFILHHYGGIYADMDIISSRNIEQLLQNEELVLFQTPNWGITNSLMASVPGHRFWEKLHEDLKLWRNQFWYPYLAYLKINYSTGSGLLWYAWSTWRDPYKYSDAVIVEAQRYGKFNWCQSTKPKFLQRQNPNTRWFHHVVGNSWHVEGLDLLLMKSVSCAPVPCTMILMIVLMFFCTVYCYIRKPQSVKRLFGSYKAVPMVSSYCFATLVLIWLS
jgi:mannosyltransferase OCH1-like enzyme